MDGVAQTTGRPARQGGIRLNIYQQTEHNLDALRIYREACRILRLPQDMRRAEIERSPYRDRLADEVIRVDRYRKKKLAAS